MARDEQPDGKEHPMPQQPQPRLDARSERIAIATQLMCAWLQHRGAETTPQLENLARGCVKAAQIIQSEA